MIHVADERFIRLIALGKKRTHRFPANRKMNGELTNPKMALGRIHKVYTQAPFGKDGNPKAKPLLEVRIDDFFPDVLSSITEEEARIEGFASVKAFGDFWDSTYDHKGIKFNRDRFKPIWVVSFTLVKVLPAGKKLIKKLEEEAKAKAQKRAKSTGA